MKNNKGAQALKDYRKAIGWSKEEVKYLRKNYKQKSDLEMSRGGLLEGRSYRTIADKRYRMGLKKERKNVKIWTDKEETALLKHWKEYNQRQLHEKFIPTKTAEQIRSKKMHMGLKKPPVWTNEERGLLIKHGANYTQTQLQSLFFPNKSLSQIASMRKHLGVKRRK